MVLGHFSRGKVFFFLLAILQRRFFARENDPQIVATKGGNFPRKPSVFFFGGLWPVFGRFWSLLEPKMNQKMTVGIQEALDF